METATMEAQHETPAVDQAAQAPDQAPEPEPPVDTRTRARKRLDERRMKITEPYTQPCEVGDGEVLHCRGLRAGDIMWIHVSASRINKGVLDFTNRDVLRRFVCHALYCSVLTEPLDYPWKRNVDEQERMEDRARYFNSPEEAEMFFDDPSTAAMVDALFNKVTEVNGSLVTFL